MQDTDEFIFGKNAVLAFLEQLAREEKTVVYLEEIERMRVQDEPGKPQLLTDDLKPPLLNIKQGEDLGKIRINKILVAEGQRADGRLKRIQELARLQRVPIATCHRRKLDQLAGPQQRHQGIVALINQGKMWGLETLLQKIELDRLNMELSGQSMAGYTLALLDGVEDPHNLGAIIRVAEAAGVKAILIGQRRSPGLTATVAKISAGAVASLPVVRVSNLVQAIETLKKYRFWVVGLDAVAPNVLTDVDLTSPLLVVIGSEGRGIGRLIKEHCDFLVKIPMLGHTESLNASVAAGIFFYEIVRQCRQS